MEKSLFERIYDKMNLDDEYRPEDFKLSFGKDFPEIVSYLQSKIYDESVGEYQTLTRGITLWLRKREKLTFQKQTHCEYT